jgi:general stress protein YciG
MDREAFREAMREIGRKGGQARAKVLTSTERKKIAVKASKAAAKARADNAKRRKGSV